MQLICHDKWNLMKITVQINIIAHGLRLLILVIKLIIQAQWILNR